MRWYGIVPNNHDKFTVENYNQKENVQVNRSCLFWKDYKKTRL